MPGRAGRRTQANSRAICSKTGDGALRTTSAGQITTDPDTCATSDPRVFAGGDVVRGERTVTAAMAWGLRAAWGIDVALRGRALWCPGNCKIKKTPCHGEVIIAWIEASA